jgi:hypothetical protein
VKFGESATFAIKIWGLQHVNRYIFGSLGLFVAGECVGNGGSALLYPFYSHLLSLQEQSAAAPAVTDEEVPRIFARIQRNMAADFEQLSNAQVKEAMRDESFQLAPGGGELFDGWLVLFAETSGATHFLIHGPHKPAYEHTLPGCKVTPVLQQFREWFERELAKTPAELMEQPITEASYQQARAELHAFLLAVTKDASTEIVGSHESFEVWWNSLISAGWSRLLTYTLLWDLIRGNDAYSDEAWNVLTESEGALIGHCSPYCFDHFYGEPKNFQEHTAYVRSLEWMGPGDRKKFGFREQTKPDTYG